MAGGTFQDEAGSTLSDINVVPLVDVVLVLLIVFMITVPQIIGSAPVKVDVPETNSIAIDTVEDLPLHFSLRPDGEGKAVLYLNDAATTKAGIKAYLDANYADAKEKPTVFLAADKAIPYGGVTEVLDLLASLGLHKINLNTKHVDR